MQKFAVYLPDKFFRGAFILIIINADEVSFGGEFAGERAAYAAARPRYYYSFQDYFLTRSMYSPVLVSILMVSPSFTNIGT